MWNNGFEYTDQIPPHEAGRTVLQYLSGRYSHSTPAQWLDRIESGQVAVNGSAVPGDTLLRVGQRLSWQRPRWEELGSPASFALLYRDDHLLGVAKPSGLACLPGGGFLSLTLLNAVRREFPEASPLHRLGRGTSGVVLFGLTSETRSILTAMWHSESVVKTYRALVRGTPPWEECVIRIPIGKVRHSLLGTVHAACPTGRPSLSRVRLLERRQDTSLVEVTIDTGRPHQIRIHMAAAGFPLNGDPLYGAGGMPAPESRALPGALGYWLHAASLRLVHPATGSDMEIACQPPPVLRSGNHVGAGSVSDRPRDVPEGGKAEVDWHDCEGGSLSSLRAEEVT